MQISSHSHFSLPYQGSNPIQKWCGSGVVSAFPCLKTIDFPGFSGTFQDVAVADEKNFNVILILLSHIRHISIYF